MPETPATSRDTPASLAVDLALVVFNAARVEGVVMTPAVAKRIAAAITDRPGLITALARGL